ncbi:hypothetical protein [Dietzia alimentaria]|uniref:hypothetical protein n=1 Tax=Dietzia alimentaria TaxID=665550 RepID=UPI00029AE1AF|nr:hypothetical protein [Dietzia alimentaria]
MTSSDDIRNAIDAATVPEQDVLERAKMIVVDKLSESDSLGIDELVESVCEAYEAPSGEPLSAVDVDPSALETDTPALRNLRYARAARTAIIDLLEENTVVAVEPQPGDPGGYTYDDNDDDEPATVAKETTDPAAEKAGADELVVITGPQPEGQRFALASR